MRTWRPIFRRARRVALRSPWRTLWTSVLVLIPVAVGTAFISDAWGHHLRWGSVDLVMGRADVLYRFNGQTPTGAVAATNALVAALPQGSRSAALTNTGGTGVAAERGDESDVEAGEEGPTVAASGIQMGQWGDPLLGGMLRLYAGRAPRRGEVVVPPAIARSLDVEIGDRVVLPTVGATLEVVGIGRAEQSEWGIVLASGELLPLPDGAPVVSETVLVDLPAGEVPPSLDTVTATVGLADPQWVTGPLDRQSIEADGSTVPTGALIGLLLATMAVVALVSGSAAGIGARRRRRASGLLAANGATRAQLATAAAAEAIVVAMPAVVLGVLAGATFPAVWTRFHLPGWLWLTDLVTPWPWMVAVALLAVAAAAVSAVGFSRALRTARIADLLDMPRRVAPSTHRVPRPATLILVTFVVLGLFVRGTLGLPVGPGSLEGMVVLAVPVLWGTCAAGALWLLPAVLERGPIGRLVGRDLRRHRLGSVAAIVVVATWVFVAVGGVATERFVNDSPTWESAPPALQREGQGVLVTSFPLLGESPMGGGWAWRGSEGSSASARTVPPVSSEPRDGLAAKLATAGLRTTTGVIGSYTGSCPVCPAGFVPTVLVLSSPEGTGLPPATVELLRSGMAVTPYEVENQHLGGVPLRTVNLPLGLSAVVLASSLDDTLPLAGARPALLGDTSPLDARQVVVVNRILADSTGVPKVGVESWDARIPSTVWGDAVRPGRSLGISGWGRWVWFAVMVTVTLVVTALHRREHGEADRVLRVLGASPRVVRRLSSLAAFSLAGVGVATGLTAVLAVVGVAASWRRAADPFDGLWNREATWLTIAALTVPILVAAIARLMPPSDARPTVL